MTKEEQRRLALFSRRALSAQQRREYSAAICRKLLRLPALREAKLILSYRALPDEVDLSALEEHIAARIALPLCLGNGIMEARIPCGPLRPGPYGIWEPDPEASLPVKPTALDLILAPCVAFDAQGRRLGHGAGYYDRYLPLCAGAKTIAVAFEAQRLERIAAEPHDRPVDAVVTEKAYYRG